MKKSIFAFITAFACGTALNAQQPDNCEGTPNKPTVGVPQTYTVAANGANYTGNGKFQWYVTQDKNLLKEDVIIAKDNNFFSSEGNSYNNTANTENSLKLSWTSDALANGNPFYLVLRYTENNGTCDAQNIKAMQIKPINTFKMDIVPVKDQQGTAFTQGDEKVCAANITSATIEGDKVKYVYGKTTLYYQVTAKGFKGDYKPTITLPALEGITTAEGEARKYESVEWSTDGGANFKSFSTVNGGTQQTLTATDNATIVDATNGSQFILKVVIDNGTYEGLTNEDVNLSTKGHLVLKDNTVSTTLRDVADDCTDLNADRNATQAILARPTLTATSGEFIIQIQ